MNLSFAFHSWRRDIGNFSLLKYRDFQGFLITGQHSGTHWLKYMLSLALADRYDLPPPQHTNNPDSNDFIGNPKHPRKYTHTPRLASSHNIPNPLMRTGITHKFVKFPPYVILVRDIRAALVSHYEKHKERYDIDFSRFVRGNPAGDRHWADIWWHIRFCNSWGKINRLVPDNTLVVHYEQLQQDPMSHLVQIRDFFKLDLHDSNLEFGVEHSSKKDMAAREKEKPEEKSYRFIRFDSRDPLSWYAEEDIRQFRAILDAHLKYRFDYDYDGKWT